MRDPDVPAARLRALITFLGPEDISPNAHRMLLALCTAGDDEPDEPDGSDEQPGAPGT